MPWFRRPSDGFVVLVPEWIPDTVERCRREGWAEVPDPRGPVARPEAPDTAQNALGSPSVPLVDTDPVETKARADEARVAQVKAVKTRNGAARKWVERKG